MVTLVLGRNGQTALHHAVMASWLDHDHVITLPQVLVVKIAHHWDLKWNKETVSRSLAQVNFYWNLQCLCNISGL